MKLISLQAYRLYGLTLCQVNNYRDAVSAFLTALDLDPDNADDLTDHIAEVAEHICHIPKDVLEKLEGKYISKIFKMFFGG